MQIDLRYLAVPLVACALAGPIRAQDSNAPNGATVVANVNGTEITLGHMIAARATLPEQYDSVPAQQLYDGILQQLIQQEALAQTVETLPPLVALTLQNEERSLRAGQAIDRDLQGAVTEEQIVAAYDEAFKDFEAKEEYNASHILVETEEEAKAVKELIDGGADFAATAREKSTGPSGPNGGELGWFGAGMMVPPFEAATIALQAGEVSEPVQTQFGWHVIKLNDVRKTEAPKLEEVRPQLENDLREKAAREIIESAAEGATVSIPENAGIDPAILTQRDLLDE